MIVFRRAAQMVPLQRGSGVGLYETNYFTVLVMVIPLAFVSTRRRPFALAALAGTVPACCSWCSSVPDVLARTESWACIVRRVVFSMGPSRPAGAVG